MATMSEQDIPQKLLWVDLEMTGLDPNTQRIIEVAALVTDFDLQELGYGSIDFSFQGGGAGADQDARPGWGDGAGARAAEAAPPTHAGLQSGARGGGQPSGDGIDIRI